jgi:hypothetical protein
MVYIPYHQLTDLTAAFKYFYFSTFFDSVKRKLADLASKSSEDADVTQTLSGSPS